MNEPIEADYLTRDGYILSPDATKRFWELVEGQLVNKRLFLDTLMRLRSEFNGPNPEDMRIGYIVEDEINKPDIKRYGVFVLHEAGRRMVKIKTSKQVLLKEYNYLEITETKRKYIVDLCLLLAMEARNSIDILNRPYVILSEYGPIAGFIHGESHQDFIKRCVTINKENLFGEISNISITLEKDNEIIDILKITDSLVIHNSNHLNVHRNSIIRIYGDVRTDELDFKHNIKEGKTPIFNSRCTVVKYSPEVEILRSLISFDYYGFSSNKEEQQYD